MEQNKTVNFLEEIQDYEAGRKFAQPVTAYQELEIFFFCEVSIFLFTTYFFGVFFVRTPDGKLGKLVIVRPVILVKHDI